MFHSLGTADFSKEIDPNVWMNAMLQSEIPGQFYPEEFREWADCVLEEWNIVQEDITPQYCREIYIHLAASDDTTST